MTSSCPKGIRLPEESPADERDRDNDEQDDEHKIEGCLVLVSKRIETHAHMVRPRDIDATRLRGKVRPWLTRVFC